MPVKSAHQKFNTQSDDYMDAINSVCNKKDHEKSENFYSSPDSSSSSTSSSLKKNRQESRNSVATARNSNNNNECVTLEDLNQKFSKRNKSDENENENLELDNQSSISMNPASVKNMKEFDDDDDVKDSRDHIILDTDDLIEEDLAGLSDDLNEAESSKGAENLGKHTISNMSITNSTSLTLSDICHNGNTFLWDLLTNQQFAINSTTNSNSENSFVIDSILNSSDLKNESYTTANLSQSSLSNSSSTQVSPTSKGGKKKTTTTSTATTANSTITNSTTSSNLTQRQKILREAEKQLQILLCLPSTDKRVRLQFIESCVQNLAENKAVSVSLRLLTKLLSSFQQYSSSNSSASFLKLKPRSEHATLSQNQQSLLLLTHTHTNRHLQAHFNVPAIALEVHKIVAWCEKHYGLVHVFFQSLVEFTRIEIEKLHSASNKTLKTELMTQIRLNVQARLQFLTFIFSSLGSPRDFELASQHVEHLWDSLVQFDDLHLSPETFLSVKDDLFNWFLTQAKGKDQHAIGINTFKLVFINKIPLLDPNSFSQNALHLYQELFKIYKISFQQQNNANSDANDALNALHFKQMEQAAINYITKLAFKSANNDVSMAAIQFLNSYYTQPDTISNVEYENQFIENCMAYLNETRFSIIENQKQGKIENSNENGIILK